MVYDCFMFFNELELLDLRLHELDAVVDRFVLVEGVRTLSGKPKPLYFAAPPLLSVVLRQDRTRCRG